MKKLSVKFFQRDFTTPLAFPRVKIIPTSMSWSAVGGCDKAHLTAYGNFNSLWDMTNWLRAPVEIIDWRGERVWWGFVNEVYVQIGSIKLGVSLADMVNRVAVAYAGDAGQVQRFTTTWGQDDLSVSTYGAIEMLTSQNYGNDEIALALRDTILAERSRPIAIPEITDAESSMSAGLELSGWFSTLDWKYYQQNAGLEGFTDTGQGVQELGRNTDSEKIAQQMMTSIPWDAAQIAINVKKEGTPGDNLVIDFCADSGSSTPGTVLGSVTVPASNVPDSLSWMTVNLPATIPLVASTSYWIVVRRTGALDADNYYKVNLNENLGYTNGVFRVYKAGWIARDPDADLNFQVKGVKETSLQITDIVTACGQFFTKTIITNASGRKSNQYRDGDTKALEEVLSLLKIGTSNAKRLLAKVTPARELIVYEEPAYNANTPDFHIDIKGKLTNRWGEKVLEHTGPVAGWCQMKDVIPPQFNAKLLADGTYFFIERADFDVQAWKLRPEPKTVRSVWDLGSILEG